MLMLYPWFLDFRPSEDYLCHDLSKWKMDLLFGFNCQTCAKIPSDGTLDFMSFWAVVPQVTSPAASVTKACSDGTQPVCSPEACSMEAFQLLQQDLTKISCFLLNYNLLSVSFFSYSFSRSLKKACLSVLLPTELCISVWVCMCETHACMCEAASATTGRSFEMIGRTHIWSGSTGSSRAKASSFIWILRVFFMATCSFYRGHDLHWPQH